MARILVIDDDSETLELLRRILEMDGHEVREALDGYEGVLLYRREPADLVITDILMPRQDGVSAINEIRRGFPDARIIAFSGGGNRGALDFLSLARRLGAQRTLAKPFSVSEIRKAVNEVLEENI